MGLIMREVRTYLCDRCGDERSVEGAQSVPAGWQAIAIGNATSPLWLCVDCMMWLRRFFEGRKVAD